MLYIDAEGPNTDDPAAIFTTTTVVLIILLLSVLFIKNII